MSSLWLSKGEQGPPPGKCTHRVLTMSTGMEAAVVTSPLIMLAQKWHRMSSRKCPGGTPKHQRGTGAGRVHWDLGFPHGQTHPLNSPESSKNCLDWE